MEIKCKERYQEALEHAEKTGDKSLKDCLKRLEEWEKNREGSVIYLTKDFAPLSFYFEWYDKENKRIMNGGLLYHGNPDQSYSVTLIPCVGWQLHT